MRELLLPLYFHSDMVFVDKTLDDMLKEIGYSNPVILEQNWRHRKEIISEGSYFLKIDVDAKDIDDVGKLWRDMQDEFCYFFKKSRHAMDHAYYRPAELIVNALEWGGGIKEINYYVTPKGIVFEIVQNKEWDYKTIVDKFKRGLYPSSRKKDETTMHEGGCGLWAAKIEKEAGINYQEKSALILYSRETVEKNIREQLEKRT